jgi:UDP-N-acetylmuramoyl-tripeptide--D-alanyl-D-alanine ligase
LKVSLTRRLKGLYQRPAIEVARRYRRLLTDTHVVGVTGSCGKTSVKDFTAAILSRKLSGRSSYDTTNGIYSIARTLLATRPTYDFVVQELGAFQPGGLDKLLQLLRPSVGVITVIGNDHYGSFKGGAGVFQEKRKLIDSLPNDGVAVLNIDDPHLEDLAKGVSVRMVSFGRSPQADVRATNVTASYPERLSFTISCAGEEFRVYTRLLGAHQLVAVLASIAVGHALGITLAEAVHAIEACSSPPGRMELVELADGVTFINDSYKAPYWTLDSVFEFMGSARATRKWIVLGTISDHPLRPRTLYRRVTAAALESCDRAVFIGPNARYAPESGGRVSSFETVQEANDFLNAHLYNGDLVFIKGNNLGEHLPRLFLSRMQAVTCWRDDCRRAIDCRTCRRLAR